MNEPLARDAHVYVAGHRGMVGSALLRRLKRGGYANLVTRTREELDLTDQQAVHRFLAQERPDYVLLAAARVGGIAANAAAPAEFLYQNLAIATNVIEAARQAGVRRLMFFGSSCIYPRDCPQPMREEYLLTGPLEPTNEPYALAKIAAIKLCEACNRQYGTQYLSVMPTNLYGPNDNYDLEASHVLPALVRKAEEARRAGRRRLNVWGTGRPRREFLHVDDLADACVFLMEHGIATGIYNVGYGSDLSIRELAELVMQIVGLDAELVFDATRPDGTPRKLLDSRRLSDLGWTRRIELAEGIRSVHADYRLHHAA